MAEVEGTHCLMKLAAGMKKTVGNNILDEDPFGETIMKPIRRSLQTSSRTPPVRSFSNDSHGEVTTKDENILGQQPQVFPKGRFTNFGGKGPGAIINKTGNTRGNLGRKCSSFGASLREPRGVGIHNVGIRKPGITSQPKNPFAKRLN